MEKIRIREISWMDWRKLAALFQGIFPELTTKEISHYIRHYEDTIAVAEASEGIVGFYQFTPRIGERTAWLNYLGVLPSHHHGGVGSQLLRDFEMRAAQMGFRQAEFDVLQQNQRAIRFYEKHGYARSHPVDNKFRYRKTLTVNVHAAGDPQPARTRPYLARVGRRVLYLMLVGLSLLFANH
ncbi:MAG: GNAT family N-acetyltransferase [Sulfuricaulis sp.]|uniref:GNAT family N-acetyltransferase n=1 Tax=Sulfuricaulis sp. TaxID=2003553 RepID=UPI0025DD2456|nr:GNAT family N-acetyltransferase [Sulfuricaulis sp.]MCR4347371.1 GNAT family N-acetyltransferase [Sulfuricaulis sp.]